MMEITKSDINFKKINECIDDLDGVDYATVLMLCSILIKTVSEQDNSSVNDQLENTKKLIGAITQ